MATTPRSSPFYADEESGIHMIWDNQFDKAFEYFGRQSNVKPRHGLHRAEVVVLKSFLTEDPKDRAEAIELLQTASQLAETHLKYYERGAMPDKAEGDANFIRNMEIDTKAVLGDCYTLSAALNVLDEKRLVAIMSLRKAWKTYEGAIKQIDKSLAAQERILDPAVISTIRFGAGLLHILISMIPPGFAQQAAGFIGFKANKKLGLEYLWSTYSTNTSIRSDFAGVIIALNNVVLSASLDKSDSQPFKDAEKILNKSISVHPNGSIFYLIRGLISSEFNMNNAALGDIQISIRNASSITESPPIFLRSLINCYMVDMNYNAAADILIQMSQRTEDTIKRTGKSNQASWSVVWHDLKLGTVFMVLEREKEAQELWKNVSKAKETDKWTTVIIKTARRYLRTEGHLSVYELMILTTQFDRLLLSGDQKKRETILESIEKLAQNSQGAKEVLNLKELNKQKKGGILHAMSLGFIGGVENNDPKLDNRTSYLLLRACTLRSMDRIDEAVSCLQEVLSYKTAFRDQVLLAMSYLELGKCSVKQNPSEAVRLWKEGIKLNGYLWEDSVKQRFKTYINNTSGEEVEVDAEPIEKDVKSIEEKDGKESLS